MTRSFMARWDDLSGGARHICLGLDPSRQSLRDWGLAQSPEGAWEQCARLLEEAAGHVSLVKPQVAFFEQFGAAGYVLLERVLGHARELGYLTILDAKRSDIGHSMEAYALGLLSADSPMRADAVTLNPYLGVGSLEPVFKVARTAGACTFVLVRTSNHAQAESLQTAVPAGSAGTVAALVAQEVAAVDRGDDGRVVAGAVVGATLQPEELTTLCGLMPDSPLLAPGVGAQGATVSSARAGFGVHWPRVILPISRGFLSGGPDGVARLAAGFVGEAEQ